MKYLTTLLLVNLIHIGLIGQQEFTKSLAGIDWVKIDSKAEIVLKTHSKNELLIVGSEFVQAPEKAKGLRLVGNGGQDNTDVGFSVLKEGNNLIVSNLRKWNKGSAEIYLPASKNVSVTTKGTGRSDIRIYGFSGEIEANARLNGGIKMEDVSGPVTANSLNGNIDISFATIDQSSPTTIYSTNGALDIKMPKDTPSSLKLNTTNGNIYSDFDIKVNKKKWSHSTDVDYDLNGGGVSINLKTTNGNIYLRKG